MAVPSLRSRDEEVQDDHHQHGRADDDDVEPLEAQLLGDGQQHWLGEERRHRIGEDAGAHDALHGVLQEEGRADGGDEQHESRGVAQRPVGDALDEYRDDEGHQGGDRHHDDDGDDRGGRARVEEADVAQEDGRVVAGEGADHEDVAVGEVDHAQDAVDHRVAQRDERIDATQGGAVDEEVDPGVDGVLA